MTDLLGMVTAFATNEQSRDPITVALSEWMLRADLYDEDGKKIQSRINLVGNEENANLYSDVITKHLRENGFDEGVLAAYLQDRNGGGKYVVAYAFAPHIARGVLRVLRSKGLM